MARAGRFNKGERTRPFLLNLGEFYRFSEFKRSLKGSWKMQHNAPIPLKIRNALSTVRFRFQFPSIQLTSVPHPAFRCSEWFGTSTLPAGFFYFYSMVNIAEFATTFMEYNKVL